MVVAAFSAKLPMKVKGRHFTLVYDGKRREREKERVCEMETVTVRVNQ